jgi:magnesium-transporting ATPase (P-type)
MDMPPRQIGKRLIGRFLFLRIMLGTLILIVVVIGSTFWAQDNGYELDQQRSVAFNALNFGSISICLSARFSYNTSIHPRLFKGNAFCWWSVLIVVVSQIAITNIPGLNSIIFNMAPMDGTLWFVSLLSMLVAFLIMEAEKALRRFLKYRGSDTDDRDPSPIFDEKVVTDGHVHLPDGASRLGLEELKS